MEELKQFLIEYTRYFDREYKGIPESYKEVIDRYESTGKLKELLEKLKVN